MQGTIVKGIAGFYYVRVEDTVFECKARGLFKKDSNIPYVGDEVRIRLHDDNTAVIDKILPRRNVFIRPPVANVEQLIITVAMAKPDPNVVIIDKFLVMAEKNNVDAVLCFNKTDLVEEEKMKEMKDIYESIYPVVFLSSISADHGLEQLKPFLKDKKSALAGPSGVGKSTILNALQENLQLETGRISHKTNRGRHTTRHVELFHLDIGGMLFDTPGFTSFEVLDADMDELQFLYPEIAPLVGQCKYTGCRHMNEPNCAIKDAVQEGSIHPSRYGSYVSQMEEIIQREKKKYL